MRTKFGISTVCYLIKDDKVLFLQFKKKWGNVYCPPGGKAEANESPTGCIIREYKEETGLELINPKLKGISYWNYMDNEYGVIFIYIANEYKGKLLSDSEEGNNEWINTKDISNLKQFDMNTKFTKEVFEDGIFEGSFKLDEKDMVKEYNIIKI